MTKNLSANLIEHSTPDFIAELTPHRSLGRTGFFVVMIIICLSCISSGLMFLKLGAWPVLIFLLGDMLIVWLAFKLSFRSGKARERISVNRHELRVEKYAPSGRCQSFLFNPFWTKFEVERHEEFGIMSMNLISPEKRLSIGCFLNPDDREDFSRAFGNALGRAKT